LRGRRRDESPDGRGSGTFPERERERSTKRAESRSPDNLPASAQGAASEGAGRVSREPRSELLQAELDECLDTIQWCIESVTRESLKDLRNMLRPPPVVKLVFETVSLLLGQHESKWDRLKKFVLSSAFLEKVDKFNFQQSVTREQFKKLREFLQHPSFDEEVVKTVFVPVVPLAAWCRAIGVHLSKTKFKGGPEIRPVASAAVHQEHDELELQQEAELVERPILPAGVFFEPDLDKLSNEELREVADLTISRPGVGTLTFHGLTDCMGLDFERIVRLEVGEVLVYPEPALKPDVGVGLNKPATVTIYQCWPPNGVVQDVRNQDKYRKKVKQMTEDKRARFIDYDCFMGVWTFEVEHF